MHSPALGAVRRTIPGSLWTLQYCTPGCPGTPKLGKVSQPSCWHLFSTTFTIPSSLCCPQNAPVGWPGLLHVACLVQFGCWQCLCLTSTMPSSIWALQNSPLVSPAQIAINQAMYSILSIRCHTLCPSSANFPHVFIQI